MKKIFILIAVLFFFLDISWANSSALCCTKKPKKTFKGVVASLSGLNCLSKNIIENRISAIVKKETNSKIKVNISGFFGVNILDGKFKHLKVKSDKFSYNGLYFSDLNIETKCKYNHISFLDETLKFEEDMILKYSLNITQDDLSKIANSKEYKKIIEKMNSDKTVSSLIQIQNSNFEIRKNKIYIKYSIIPSSKHDVIAIITKNIKPLKISIGADLRVVDGKIELCNLKSSKYSNLAPIINRLNPLSYNLDIDKNNKGELKVKHVEIKDDKINIQGLILIPKS